MSNKALKSIIIVSVVAIAIAGYLVTYKNTTPPQKEVTIELDTSTQENEQQKTASMETSTPKAEEVITEDKTAEKTETAIETVKEDTKVEKADTKTFDVKKAMKDRVKGRIDAPITIYEYASYTCSHCADFYTKTFPKLKEKFIDTGMVKFIFRDFPLDAYAFTASKITRCLVESQYYNMVEVFFANQKRWLQSPNPTRALAQLGALTGMNEEKFTACNNNEDLNEAIMKSMKKAQEDYNIKATPTFVFNDGDEVLSGNRPIKEFERVILKLIAEKTSEQGK